MRNLSWRVKLMGLFTLILGASLIFQLFYVLPTVRNQQVDMIEAHQAELAHNIAWQLETDLCVLESTLIGLAERAEFRNMDIDGQQQTVNQIAEMSPDINSLYVMDAEGWFVAGIQMTYLYTEQKAILISPTIPLLLSKARLVLPEPVSYKRERSLRVWSALPVPEVKSLTP